MITMRDLNEIVNGLKGSNIHKKIYFGDMLALYAEVVDYYKLYMEEHSHFLKNRIYVLCLLIEKTYITWSLEHSNTEILKIDENFVKNKILVGFSNNGVVETFKKIISKLFEKDTLDDIKQVLDEINEKIKQEINDEMIQISIQEIHSYCPDMETEYIISRSNNILYYEDSFDFSGKLLEEQRENNNIPDISEHDFFVKYPEFKKAIDKHGLIDLSFENSELLKKINMDGVYYKDYFIYFDKLLGYWGENLMYLLIDEAYNDDKVNVKIKLNFDKIISLKKFRHVKLLGGEYYGPPYNPDKFFINRNKKPELTVKIRESKNFYDSIGNNISRTEFCFDPKNNSFLVEEIGKNLRDGFYLNRLAHSEFNIKNNTVKHFDGSILFYETNLYFKREASDLIKRDKLEVKKEKIFQLDGEISINRWEEFLLGYYQCNEMVLEYLDEESYKEQYSYLLKSD